MGWYEEFLFTAAAVYYYKTCKYVSYQYRYRYRYSLMRE